MSGPQNRQKQFLYAKHMVTVADILLSVIAGQFCDDPVYSSIYEGWLPARNSTGDIQRRYYDDPETWRSLLMG